jgi:arylsulfatase A-like enzyme
MLARSVIVGIVVAAAAFARQPLLVISVDGLDQRYLADADAMKLKIPNLRRLMRDGQWSRGVVGVVPTITWPSHTTMITGVDPERHGIRGNRRPASEGGDYYWSAKLLKARTLLDAAREAGLKTATITWPVTVDAPVDYNLPEYFQRRRGGSMDLRSIGSKSTPADLVERIAGMFPSFAQEWMDDRTRTQAVVYLLRTVRPDLILLHLVDLDSEQHDNGPFTREAAAMLEYTDELIGRMLETLPRGYAVAVVSDHGFERIEHEVTLAGPGLRASGGTAVAETEAAASSVRGKQGVGREVPKEEVARIAPQFARAAAVFESAPGFWFTPNATFDKPHELGNHGHWPARYRAVFVLHGAGIKRESLGEFSMKEIAGRLAGVIGVRGLP